MPIEGVGGPFMYSAAALRLPADGGAIFAPRSAIFALLERQEVQTARASLATFAKRLCRDDAALFAALQQPWRNGPPSRRELTTAESHQRSMYNRACCDLLRLCVLNLVCNPCRNYDTKILWHLQQTYRSAAFAPHI